DGGELTQKPGFLQKPGFFERKILSSLKKPGFSIVRQSGSRVKTWFFGFSKDAKYYETTNSFHHT
ncbi:MAG: hypothetical protein KC418_17755, partial [Anaerolineales bacterium]|nr:hypothetical protein [Anaerolineales bacterium]